MALVKEFQEFIARGNAFDMAIGVIIGAAFGKITNSLVTDMIMPPVGLIIGNAPFKSLAFTLKPEEVLANGTVIPAVTIGYGLFIQTIVDFLIISACVFALIKVLNMLHNKPVEAPAESKPAPPPEDIQLLREIRDSIRQQKDKVVL
jgi:large conductance mechanosensitive channel